MIGADNGAGGSAFDLETEIQLDLNNNTTIAKM